MPYFNSFHVKKAYFFLSGAACREQIYYHTGVEICFGFVYIKCIHFMEISMSSSSRVSILMLSLGCMSFCCEQKGITSVCLCFHYHHQVGEVAQTKPSHRDRDGVVYLENEGRIETENRLVDFD